MAVSAPRSPEETGANQRAQLHLCPRHRASSSRQRAQTLISSRFVNEAR